MFSWLWPQNNQGGGGRDHRQRPQPQPQHHTQPQPRLREEIRSHGSLAVNNWPGSLNDWIRAYVNSTLESTAFIPPGEIRIFENVPNRNNYGVTGILERHRKITILRWIEMQWLMKRRDPAYVIPDLPPPGKAIKFETDGPNPRRVFIPDGR